MSLIGGIGSLFGIDSPERAKAAEDRQRALTAAKDQAEVLKQLILSNQGIASDLDASFFGESPDAIAQRLANEREALAAQGGSSGTTKSGRRASFDFGNKETGAESPSSTSAGNKLPAGWIDPNDPKVIADSYKYYKSQYPNISLEEYTRMVHEANPDGRPRKQLPAKPGEPPKYEAVSDAEWQQAREQGYTTSGTPAKNNAQITDADRQRAQRIAQANYGKTVPGMLDSSLKNRESAADKFKAALDGIDRVNPGEYQNAWDVKRNKEDYISPEARAAQKAAMDKTFALTDTKETAEEKLMREVARRKQERDLRAQSEAQANQLRARGAYGSGAEMAGFLGAQQELAQRRSLEEMDAAANAQKRAIDALGQYGEQAFKLGNQDTTVGGLMDLNDRFNSGQRQDFQKFKTKTQQEENDAVGKREASKLDASNQVEDARRGNIDRTTNLKTQIAGIKTGNNTTAANLGNDATKLITGAWGESAGQHAAQADKDEDLLSFF